MKDESDGGKMLIGRHDFVLFENGSLKRIQIEIGEYEDKFMNLWLEFATNNFKEPTFLVVSSLPYQALRVLSKIRGGLLMQNVEFYNGMKVIHLERWDKEIIEVG